MDLKHINGITFLHIIDNEIRFSAAAVVKSKGQEKIDIFIKHWIAIFGASAGMIISDNGNM